MTKTFQDWCRQEAGRIIEELRRDAMAGIDGKTVYFVPSTETEFARLVLAYDKPEGATETIRFRAPWGELTERLGAIPYDWIRPQLYHIARSFPVYPSRAA